ncbi:FAD/NAD(P)-binding domain-containing protein [Gymnopus androsaceus JB14]|uniref:FAD/NAD(P)-binding domain-containing protein n=1 Tax=Gymnopus androsaceus JB14 TaxID=1447944 RepID=A0A6A4H1I2_9AGAR|nr:FAD/NAD(P)-binding domain-containing protein [Gymnopus androsaceus JB14]
MTSTEREKVNLNEAVEKKPRGYSTAFLKEDMKPPQSLSQDSTSLTSSKESPHNQYESSDKQAKTSRFPRLSRPVVMMRPEYEVVVIGSGYGGGVAASRMARAGKRVAILELGKERWPGEFPVTPADVAPEVHVSGDVRNNSPFKDLDAGKPTGLYHLMIGEGQNAFVGNGLGGTSLLNANVFLGCDRRTLQLNAWPVEIREDPSTLDPYYAKAAEMLQPSPYPSDYPSLKKLSVLEKQAKALGQGENFYRVPQTTFFHNGLNNAGVEMKASTGSGQDYAWNHGAEIFCECEVRYIQRDPKGNGYIIFYAWHRDDRKIFKDSFYNELMWKEFCFLGAGALGTTEILLRSRAHGLKLSRTIGQKMSGNGDILSFGCNTDEDVNGVGREEPPTKNPTGPTITGIIDNRGPETSPNVLDGYVIEEGAIPEALAPLIHSLMETQPHAQQYTSIERLRYLFSETETRFFGPYAKDSPINRTQTYLVMSHDSNEAILSLRDDKPHLQFLGVGRTEHVKKLNEILAKATVAIGGTLVNSPFHQEEAITVHPLGGAIMSSDGTGTGGATNHLGQLFNGEGAEVYEGLICVDGAVIPTALGKFFLFEVATKEIDGSSGVNPFATITALAERSVDYLAQSHSYTISLVKNGALDLFGKPAKSFAMTPDMIEASNALSSTHTSGIRFTEIMEGHIYIGDDIDEFTVAENAAKGSSSSAKVYLSIDAYSVKNLIERDDHPSLATGTFSCGALSKHPLLVLQSKVQFFSVDNTVSDATNLAYKLTLFSTEGETYLLNGYKKIDSEMSFSVSDTWKAMTTLYTTLSKLDGSLVGKGKLYVSRRNFFSEMKSFGSTGGGILQSVIPIAGFLGHFAKNTTEYFLGPLRKLQYPSETSNGYFAKTPPAEQISVTAKDGVSTTMKMWLPQGDTHKSKRPILMIPGSSVDDQVFSLPTIPVNTVEFFTSRGYQVYVSVPRYGRTPAAELGYTVFDARLDVLAAMQYVREHHTPKMYVLCHCQGAVATSMGILDGTILVSWIQGMSVSQTFFKQQFGELNAVKARTQLLPTIYEALGSPWFPTSSTPNESSAFQVLLDQIVRFYPVGSKAELCNSTVCHRGSLCYGRMWNHENLTHATHEHLDAVFGGVHMTLLRHLMRMGTAHEAMDNEFNSLVTDANLERFKGLPISFISGGDNVVYSPESTSMSYDVLRENFGTELYRRHVVQGYGHLDTWMGKNTAVDVYPLVAEHVEWCERF